MVSNYILLDQGEAFRSPDCLFPPRSRIPNWQSSQKRQKQRKHSASLPSQNPTTRAQPALLQYQSIEKSSGLLRSKTASLVYEVFRSQIRENLFLQESFQIACPVLKGPPFQHCGLSWPFQFSHMRASLPLGQQENSDFQTKTNFQNMISVIASGYIRNAIPQLPLATSEYLQNWTKFT